MKDVNVKFSEVDMNGYGQYIKNEKWDGIDPEIHLWPRNERQVPLILNHEMRHHILTDLFDKEVNDKAEKHGLTYWLDFQIFSTPLMCVKCDHYKPREKVGGGGFCEIKEELVRNKGEACSEGVSNNDIREAGPFDFLNWLKRRRCEK